MKRPLKFIPLLLVIAVVGCAVMLVLQRPRKPSGSIVLPDGSWAQVEAITYGTNHLVGPPLAFLADRMPSFVRNLMLRWIGRPAVMRFSTTTTSTQLVVWLNRGMVSGPFPSNLGWMTCALGDTNGFTSGQTLNYPARYALEYPGFNVLPRRERELTVNVFHHDPTGAVFSCGSIVFANPLYRSYPEWTPEPLPSVKRAGDVEVTLEKLITGVSQVSDRKRLKDGSYEIVFNANEIGGRNDTACFMRLRSLVNTNEVWRVAHVDTSDATGNRIGNVTLAWSPATGCFTYSPALWPRETWKLNCEIMRTSGFTADKQFTFHNVPLGAFNVTNQIGWTTNCNGVTVALEHVFRHAPATNESTRSHDLSASRSSTCAASRPRRSRVPPFTGARFRGWCCSSSWWGS